MSESENASDSGLTSEASQPPLAATVAPILSSVPTPEALQFRKAEQAAPEGSGPPCVICSKQIVDTYYHAQGQVACPVCAAKIQAGQNAPPAHTLAKSFIYGLGAALAGMALFATVWIISNAQWALISILIGYMVGKAIRIASKGLGGRPQQILAVVLTYFAISTAIIPVAIYQQMHEPTAAQASPVDQTKNSGDAQAKTSAASNAPAVNEAEPKQGLLNTLFSLIGTGLISPFLGLKEEGMGGLLTLLIIFFGLQRAWHLTGRTNIVVMGPYQLGS